jgi:hypothetical protein
MVAAQETKKRVDWTKMGLLLLLIGILHGRVPNVGIVGLLLIVIGGFFVIFGRTPFGPLHSRNVMISLFLVIAGIVAEIALFVIFIALLIGQFASGGTTNPSAILQAAGGLIDAYLIGTAVASSVIAFAALILTYSLQQRLGQYLLWVGLAANVAVQVVRFLVIRAFYASLSSGGFPTTTVNTFALSLFTSQAIAVTLLGGIPAVLNGAAYYLAWNRVNHGEIPVPPAGQPPPTYPTYPVAPPAGPG